MQKNIFIQGFLFLIAILIVWWLRSGRTDKASTTYLSLENTQTIASEQIEHLDLSNENLLRLPDKLFNYTHLKILILDGELPVASHLLLQDIYASYQYPSLEDSIQIANYTKRSKGNQISFIPNSIERLSQLEKLSIKNNQLSELPSNFSQLRSLIYLDLSGNKLSILAPNFGDLSAMKYLDLSNNELTELDQQMPQMQKLKELYLSKNKLSEFLPFAKTDFEELEILEMNDNQFSKFPLAILKMKSLKSLEMSNNQLSLLPDDLSSLRNIEFMDFKENHFEEAEIRRIKKALPSTTVVFE